MAPSNTTTDLNETIYTNGSSYFDALLADLDQAKQSVDLETYIFNTDSLGNKVATALINAAQRGVKIRVLVDGAGSPLWGGSTTKNMESAGIEVRVFHPYPWGLWQLSHSVTRAPSLLKIVYLLLKINSRNHRKVCILDGQTVYTGSLNINLCHISKEHGGQGWRDTGMKITGANITDLQRAFDHAWQHKQMQERIREAFQHINNNPIFRLNNTWYRRRIMHKNLLRKMSRCKQRIWITNSYFVPDNFLLRKLKEAARANIDVRILLPRKSDVFIMPWASTAFYASLLKAGARIFEYLPSILHAKILILDDWISVGSSNLNHRSLLHDLEVDVNVRLKASKQLLEKQFLEDVSNSREVQLHNWKKRPLYQRIIGRLLLYVKYWI